MEKNLETIERQCIPACLVNVRTLRSRGMWCEMRKGTSNKYIDLPRGLLWAGRFAHPEEDYWIALEVQKLEVSHFKQMESLERIIRKKYVRLCVFKTDKLESTYEYIGGDIVQTMFGSSKICDDEVGLFGCLALAWIKNSFTSHYWKSDDHTHIYNSLVLYSQSENG